MDEQPAEAEEVVQAFACFQEGMKLRVQHLSGQQGQQ
jgi:hypothetical protein